MLALQEMYVQGVSTRKVSAIVEQLCGATISASEVSALVKKLDVELAAWRSRHLDSMTYPILIIDAHHEQVRRDGQVRSTAMLWVIGVSADGHREHLGCWLGVSESGDSWGSVFAQLRQRGIRGVQYVVSDEHQGLVTELRRYFPRRSTSAARCTTCATPWRRSAGSGGGSAIAARARCAGCAHDRA